MNEAENLNPYSNDERPKGEQIKEMFDGIAPQYDLLNQRMSMGLDKMWRQRAIAMIEPFAPKRVLDVATGTGDLAIEIKRNVSSVQEVLGVDLSAEMMRIAESKVYNEGWEEAVRFEVQDCMQLDLDDESFDAATVAFGVRNFQNVDKGLKELWRVLRPGAPLMILELSEPKRMPWKAFYQFYSKRLIPLMGRFLSKDADAYRYLPESIRLMPQRRELCDLMLNAGFEEAYYRSLSFGVASIYMGIK